MGSLSNKHTTHGGAVPALSASRFVSAVSRGVKRYYVMSSGGKWCQVVSSGIKRSQAVSRGVKWHQVASSGVEKCKVASSGMKWCQVVSSALPTLSASRFISRWASRVCVCATATSLDCIFISHACEREKNHRLPPLFPPPSGFMVTRQYLSCPASSCV